MPLPCSYNPISPSERSAKYRLPSTSRADVLLVIAVPELYSTATAEPSPYGRASTKAGSAVPDQTPGGSLSFKMALPEGMATTSADSKTRSRRKKLGLHDQAVLTNKGEPSSLLKLFQCSGKLYFTLFTGVPDNRCAMSKLRTCRNKTPI